MLSMTDKWLLRLLGSVDAFDRRRASAPGIGAGATPVDGGKALAVGSTLAGRYKLVSMLGEGGMGRVWSADDTLEKRRVAIKEMRVGVAEGDTADIAFKQEFYTMTKLQHPNTVRVYDYGVLPSGDRYIAMDVVDGRDVSAVLKRGPLELKQVYRVLLDMANVLGFIHSRRFVHCDIKSANVRITQRGGVKLMDFGLMHQLGTPSSGGLKGTLSYMAPEIPRGGVIDGRTDLYSLGVLAFEMATGRYPFEGKTPMEIISQHLEAAPPAMRRLREVPEAFEKVVARLLAKDPKDRHPDANELIRELAALAGVPAEVQDYSSRASYLHAAELVGRQAEQAALREAVTALQQARGRSMFLTAPAGLGKTRLLQEFRLAVKLADIPLFVAQCRAEGQPPLAPLVELLGQLLPLAPKEALAQHGPRLARIVPRIVELGIAAAAPMPAAAEKPLLFEALRGLLRAVATSQPFVLCLEDLHWADSATIEFLNVTIRELVDRRGMVLGTFRANEVDRFSPLFFTVNEKVTTQLELPALSPQSTLELVSVMLKGLALPPEFAQRLVASTMGNAFFVTELMRTLVEQGRLQVSGGRWALDASAVLPASIEEAVGLRLGALPAEALSFCCRLAPLGRQLELGVVRGLSDLDDTRLFAQLDDLTERQFIQRTGQDFYFSHDTVRAAIYARTPEPERELAHERIGQLLERRAGRRADEDAAQLGYHFARGKDHTRAIRYLSIASDRALGNSALLEGTQLLSTAADLLEKQVKPEDPSLLEMWARLVEVGSLAHPPTCARYADKLCPPLEQRVGGGAGVAAFNAESRRLLENPGFFGARKLKAMWSEHPLEGGSHDVSHLVPKLVSYRNAQAVAFGVMGQTPRAMELVGKSLAENPDPGPFRASAQISKAVGLFHMGMWAALRNEAGEANAWFADHLARVGELPNRLQWSFASTFYWTIQGSAATGLPVDPDLLRRGLELCQQRGFGDWRFFLMLSEITPVIFTGDRAEMERTYGPLSDLVRRLGNPPLMEGRLSMLLPSYYLQRKEKELAVASIEKVERTAEMTRDAWMRRYALFYRAQLAHLFSPLAEAEKALEAAQAAAKEAPSFSRLPQLDCLAASLEAGRGRHERAHELAASALGGATAPPTASAWDECTAWCTRAAIFKGAEGLAAARQAVEITAKYQQPILQARAAFELARQLMASDRAAAATALADAERRFGLLECNHWLGELDTFRRRAAGVA